MKLTLAQQLKRAHDEARGFEANWRLALAERDESRAHASLGAIYLDKVLGKRNRLALALKNVLESNQLLRGARLMGKGKQVIDSRTGGLAHAEMEARAVLDES